MAVIPLVPGRTVVTTEEAFQATGGRGGTALLIRNFDGTQLADGMPNLSYDLRVGGEYKDHRDGWKRDVSDKDPIELLPGAAVIIETEENLHLPKGMFGYIVPRVDWLQRGVSNTSSKVDAGYNGRLLITLFNLGRKEVKVRRRDRFCSLVVHSVEHGAVLYDKDAKKLSAAGRKQVWQKIRDGIESNRTTVEIILIIVTLSLAFADVHLYGALKSLSNILDQLGH